jgi:hypothetical protein
VFKTRVFRFTTNGAPQITQFPDNPPDGESDLDVRIKHFTEIENFSFLGYTLAHEMKGKVRKIEEPLPDVEDKEVQEFIDSLKVSPIGDEGLGDLLLDIGINWEHFVASTDSLMVPGSPLTISDKRLQAKIDALDELSEALVREVNRRSRHKYDSDGQADVTIE